MSLLLLSQFTNACGRLIPIISPFLSRSSSRMRKKIPNITDTQQGNVGLSTFFRPIGTINTHVQPISSHNHMHHNYMSLDIGRRNVSSTAENVHKSGRKLALKVASGIVGLCATALGGVAFAIALKQQNDYPLYKKLWLSCDSILRFARTAKFGFLTVLDYKWTWFLERDNEERNSKLHKRAAERLLKLCEINGGAYIKLGQYVASMNYILPNEYITTLSKLQDKAPWIPFEEIEELFTRELGHSPDYFFKEMDRVPIAAASIAQVYRAVTHDGREVAVKVQYPKVSDRFLPDMFAHDVALEVIAMLFKEWEFTWMGPEIRENLSKELDFLHEAHNSERAAVNLSSMKHVYIPKVYWDMTTKRVLTMEFIHGCKITDIECLKRNKFNIREVTKTMIEAFANQIFVHGFVHCDPHPGNILVRWNAANMMEVVLLDHGLYKELSNKFRTNFCRMWKALVMQDEETVKRMSSEFGVENYEVFAILILMRSYKGTNVGLSSKMTLEEAQALILSLRDQMQEYCKVLRDMPRELLLVLRNNNLLRSINRELGIPVNRFSIMARTAVKGLHGENGSKWGILHQLFVWKELIIFDAYLKMYEFSEWVGKVYLKVLQMTGAVPMFDLDEIEMQLESAS